MFKKLLNTIKINTLYAIMEAKKNIKKRLKKEMEKIELKSSKELYDLILSKISIEKFVLNELNNEDMNFEFTMYGKDCKFKMETFYTGNFGKSYFMFLVYVDNKCIALTNQIFIPSYEEIEEFKVNLEKFNNPMKYYHSILPSQQHNLSQQRLTTRPSFDNKYKITFKSDFEMEKFFLEMSLSSYGENFSNSFNSFMVDNFTTNGDRNLYTFLDEDIRYKTNIIEKYTEGGVKGKQSDNIIEDIKALRILREKIISKNF